MHPLWGIRDDALEISSFRIFFEYRVVWKHFFKATDCLSIYLVYLEERHTFAKSISSASSCSKTGNTDKGMEVGVANSLNSPKVFMVENSQFSDGKIKSPVNKVIEEYGPPQSDLLTSQSVEKRLPLVCLASLGMGDSKQTK